jgi:MFS transporter, DHA2 family, multidrug resistance protein
MAGIARIDWLPIVLAFVMGTIFAYALRRRESERTAPILAIDLFRIPLFSLSAATSLCSFLIQGLVFVALPFLFQSVMGFSQVEAGLLITPWPATLALMTLIAAPLADRLAPGLLGGIGLVLLACGLILLALLPVDAGIFDIAWRLVLCGVGFGFFQSPNMLALMSSAPSHRSGGASGILAASRLFGQSIGAAIVAICLTLASIEGVTLAIWIAAAVALLGSIFSLLRLLPGCRLG